MNPAETASRKKELEAKLKSEWEEYRIRRQVQEAQPTLTSGFNREILRLTGEDVQFLNECGIKAE